MALAVRGLAKSFPRLAVLKDLDLDVADGEVVAIRGQSGTGKSTLLHCLGLLERCDAGAIALDGQDLAALAGAERSFARATRVSFVFQAFNLLPEFSTRENVLIAARIAEMPLDAAVREADALLARVGLADRADADVRTLSGGERQRVALCRALLTAPKLLLADEPTGNLDPTTAAVVLDELIALARDRRASVIIVTHDPEIAKRADRVLELKGGRLFDVAVAAGAVAPLAAPTAVSETASRRRGFWSLRIGTGTLGLLIIHVAYRIIRSWLSSGH